MTHHTSSQPVIPPRGGRVWVTSVTLSIVAGIAAATSKSGNVGLPLLAVALGVVGCVMAGTLRRVRTRLLGVLRWGVAFGLAGTAGIGLLGAFDSVGLLWILGLVLANPLVRWRIRRCLPASSSSVSAMDPLDDLIPDHSSSWPNPATVQDLHHLSVEALCTAWRRSYVGLERARSTPCITAFAAQREQILKELDRRDGPGVSRWLASNPRAAGNPLPYLNTPCTIDTVDKGGSEEERPEPPVP